MSKLSLNYSFDLLCALLAAGGGLAVLYTFVVGRHYIIPSVILIAVVLLGNLAWYGLHDRLWAKYVLLWMGFLTTAHAFFALFFSQRYRQLLGDAFEVSCGAITLILAYLVYQYARRNRLWSAR